MTSKAILLMVTVALAGCAAVGGTTARQLVGRWRAATGERTAEYHFRADGTFSGSVHVHGAMVSDFTGRWSMRHNVIRYDYLGDAMGYIPPGTHDEDVVVSVARDHFVIQPAAGSRRTYQRIDGS